MEDFQRTTIYNIIQTWQGYSRKKLNTIYIELGTNSSITYIETEDKIKCIVPNEECYRRLSNELNRQIALRNIRERDEIDSILLTEKSGRISKLVNSRINKPTKPTKTKRKPGRFKDER